jgi:glycine oxidase
MPILGTYDAVVIGGGACGCTTAYFLREEGLNVALADKGRVGQEASWASAGMIGPMASPPRDPWFLRATTLSKALYDELNERLFEETGRRIGYGGEGALCIAQNGREAEEARLEMAVQKAGGVPVQMLTGEEARRREPALPERVVAAAWMPEGRFLDARNYTATVALAAQQKGVIVHEGWPVTGMVWEGDRVIGVRSGPSELHAGVVINAAGAWAGRLDPRLTHPVYPDHGQIMAVAGPPCGLRHNVWPTGIWGYATPRTDGRVVVGATHDDWGFQKKVTPEGVALLSEIVRYVLPCLQDRPILDVWSGLRPGTRDGMPTLGPDPRVGGGYLWAAGFAASGMMQAPAAAKMVADMAMGRQPRIPMDQVRMERYL